MAENVYPLPGDPRDEPRRDGPRRYRFPLIPFDQITPRLTARYLVKGLVAAESLCVAWGPPKCGKSFWTFDLAMHIATGMPYRGLRTRQGPVVYVAAEGADGFKARVEAWRRTHLADDATVTNVPFYLLPMRVDLTQDHVAFVADVRLQLAEIAHARGIPEIVPALVPIDTLNRTFVGSESSDEDMTAYIRAADAIKDAFHCSVIVVHHCGIEGSRPRGHTSLTGAADTQIAIKREDGLVTAVVEWMKDGPEGYANASRLEIVEIGEDEDGDAVTTCVIQPSDAPVSREIKKDKPKPLPALSKIALATLSDCVLAGGKIPTTNQHIPSNTRCVTIAVWKAAVEGRVVADGKADSQRRAFSRATDVLVERGYIAIWQNLVWLTSKGNA
jgi:hypothetical protein